MVIPGWEGHATLFAKVENQDFPRPITLQEGQSEQLPARYIFSEISRSFNKRTVLQLRQV